MAAGLLRGPPDEWPPHTALHARFAGPAALIPRRRRPFSVGTVRVGETVAGFRPAPLHPPLQVLRAPAPARDQLPQEKVRAHQPAAPQEEAQVKRVEGGERGPGRGAAAPAAAVQPVPARLRSRLGVCVSSAAWLVLQSGRAGARRPRAQRFVRASPPPLPYACVWLSPCPPPHPHPPPGRFSENGKFARK